MDIEDLEGSVGSDLDDLINIECDMEDDDIENIDTSLLLSDTEPDNQPELITEVKAPSPEPKVDATKSEVEEVKTTVEPEIPPVKKEDANKVEATTAEKLETKTPVTSVAKVESKTQSKEVETKTPGITETKTPGKTETKTPGKTETETPAKAETKTSAKVETKTPVKAETKTPVKADSKTPTSIDKSTKSESKPPGKVETKTPAKSNSKPPVKTDTKTPAKSETKPAVKVQDKVKNGQKSTEKTLNKPPVKKPENKAVDKKEDSKKKVTSVPSDAELVIIDDDEDEVRSVETIEGDVDDFPEEWMVIDEMDDESKGKDASSKRDDKSRQGYDSSRNRSRRRRSRSRSRTRTRSRSRGRGRSDSRRRERERDNKSRSSHRTPEKKGPAVSKPTEKSKPVEKNIKPPQKKATGTSPKTTPVVKQPEPLKPVDPFKNMRDTIEKFDKSWRWNLKISPVDINDLNNETFRQIMTLANDSVLVFNMQNDKKRKYGFLDLCLTSAGEIRQALDKLSQLRLETNFVHVSVSHKLFEENAGTESALLKLDLREGKHITSTPVKGTEKQRKINISNGPKGMSKIILDAIFAKIVNIVITDNSENETRNATVMCANPESVGGVLRFYQSVVIGGRRLQIRSEVPPPPPLKDLPKEDKKSPAVSSNNEKSNNQKSRQDDRNKRQNDNRNNDNRRRGGGNNNDGLLGPAPGSQDRRRAMEEAERRQESLSRLGITVGVDDFMERPGLLEAPDIVIKETKRLQREFTQNQQIFENNMVQEFRMQEEMRVRELELRYQSEIAEQKRQHEELIIRMQQEREQQLQAQKRIELEQQERERLQRLERVSLEKERLERQLLERQKQDNERLERLKQAKLEGERIEREKIERKRKEEEERLRKEKLAREQLEREQRERERLEEIKRQTELRHQREDRDAKLRQEQQQRDRYLRPDIHHGSANNWQRSLHLQNEQEQFEKEIGLRNDTRKRQSRFDAAEQQQPEEKKNLHQKIREQWEKQVNEASRSNQSVGQNNQRDNRRNDSNGNNQGSNWGRSADHVSDLSNQDPYGGTWDTPASTEGSGYGGSWGAPGKGQGLLGAAPNHNDPVPSAYNAAVREYGHQGGKRSNPWGEEAPNYGEKRNRGAEMGDFNYHQRELPSLLGQRPEEQWNAPPSREPERNYDQGNAGWGSGATDPFRNQAHQQQHQQQHPPQKQYQHHQHQQHQQYHPNW